MNLIEAIKASWDHLTSNDPDAWIEQNIPVKKNPAWGQCVPTSLVLNDYLGGDIIRSLTPFGSHYYNSIDGYNLDITRYQFKSETPITNPQIVNRDYLLESYDVQTRYYILRRRVGDTFGF